MSRDRSLLSEHLHPRLLALKQAGLLTGENERQAALHLASCMRCRGWAELIGPLDPEALNRRLMARVARSVKQFEFGARSARPMPRFVTFEIPDRAPNYLALVAAAPVEISEASDDEMRETISAEEDGEILVRFPPSCIGATYEVVAVVYGRVGSHIAEGQVSSARRRLVIRPTSVLDELRDDGWQLRLTLVSPEAQP